MPILLQNALLADLDPLNIEAGSLRLDAGIIAARGHLTPEPADECFDCGGRLVLPGLVNGHTHLYSALAVGMPPPLRAPANFLDILKLIWWRLDQALDPETIRISAQVGALSALYAGTTTLIDHHASPSAIEHSLDHIAAGIASIGLRGILCYETTDRHGPAGRRAGLEENRRFLAHCAGHNTGQFAGLVGAHASFTLEDETLSALAGLADQFAVGLHIHLAEDPCDEQITRRQYAAPILARFERHNLLRPHSIFAHGTHLAPDFIARLNDIQPILAHNPRSNMNNSVGYAPLAQLRTPILLGTDGIGGNLLTEAQTAWFKSRDAGCSLGPAGIVAMLAASARRASVSLGVTLGKLTPGAAADIALTSYLPATPLTAANLPAHLIFGLQSHSIPHVLIAGQWALKNHIATRCDEPALHSAAQVTAQRLWDRLR